MNKWLNIENLKTEFLRIQTKSKKLYKEVWPVNWSNFKKPKLILVSLLESSYFIKSLFFISFTGLLVSIYFLFLGNYMALTVEVPKAGGEVREAVVDSDFKLFNPVLELNSEAEKKVSKLLFHPLYEVTFPDFLNDSTTETKIKPILITKKPEWQDLNEKADNRYKILRFELKSNLKWSNGSNITIEDLEYTFDRLKEPKSNSQFNEVFSKVEFVPVSQNEFELRTVVPNPQLINLANFSPISKDFYEQQNTEKLYTTFNSSKPLVTSGYFTFTADLVKDPDNSNLAPRDNPIREGNSDNYKTVILTQNPYQNSGEKPNIEKYIITRYSTLTDIGGVENDSLERASKNGKIDIFTRPLGLNSTINSVDLKSKLGLNQKVISTNTYYNLYLNIRRNDLFLNQQLRKYVVCNLINYKANNSNSFLESIPQNKRQTPLQLGIENKPECPENTKDILDNVNFKLEEDPQTGIKKLLTCGRKCTQINKLNVIAFDDSNSLITDLQGFLRDIGMPAEVYKSSDEVQRRLASKDYSMAFLPITLVSRDPYPIFGSKARDLSQIRLNNQKAILDGKIEDNLYNYSISDLTDKDSKQKLVNFFSTEYISMNLFRSKFEINYSDRINSLSTNLPEFYGFINQEIYNTLPNWYIQTKRQWK